MSIKIYSAAISDAVKKGNLREMKSLLARAQKLTNPDGDIPAAIKRLQKAITKLSPR